MRYELQLFERIIAGDLSPFADGLNDPLKYNHAIREKHSQCYKYTVASFKKVKNKFSLIEKRVMSSLHPLAEKIVTPQQNLFKVAEIRDIAPDAYKLLKLNLEDVVSVSYSQIPNGTTIYIKQKRLCEEIPHAEAKYYYYNDVLKAEVVRIKESIKDTVFSITAPGALEEFIHRQQQALINLSYSLIKILDTEKQNDIYKSSTEFTDIDILNLTYIKLEELLRFLEKNYLNYIDKNIQVPFRSSLVKLYNTTEKLEFVKSAMLNSNIPPGLLNIIYVPLLKLGAITLEERISYREFIYCNTYLDAFYRLVKEQGNMLIESNVREIIYQVNYNSLDLQRYKVNFIKDQLELLTGITEKVEYLYLSLKIINQRSSRPNISFDPGLPSLKQLVSTWIEEEISYLNKKRKLNEGPIVPDLFSGEQKVKLESGLSVAQLAFFYKLQADVGIISHKTQTDIFRHIAENYKTANTSEISSDSVKNKYYNFEGSTVDVIKEKIIEILNKIKSHHSYM